MANNLDQQIATLTASVAALKTAGDSAVVLLNGVKQLVADATAAALAKGATDEQLQAFTDLNDKLDAETAAIANAVASNTPSPQPPQMKSKRPK